MKKILALTAFALALSVGSAPPAYAGKKAELTPMELQSIQAREFEVDKATAFSAVMSVIQDLGYTLESADVSSGFITASSPNENKTNFFEALGGIQSHGNTMMTAFLMQMPNGMTKIRLNFVNSKKSSGSWGRSNQKDKPILDPAVYNNAWERIDETLFVLGALTTPAPARQEPTSPDMAEALPSLSTAPPPAPANTKAQSQSSSAQQPSKVGLPAGITCTTCTK